MFICIVSGNLQADISDLPYFGRPHRKWRCRPSQSQPATTALAQNRASIARTAATALDGTICHGPTAARAAILDETTWDGPSATRAAITAFTVDRHSAMLHHVAQRSSYHPATLAWQRHFLDVLVNQRHTTPSVASSAGVPHYSSTFPYQEHEWTASITHLLGHLQPTTAVNVMMNPPLTATRWSLLIAPATVATMVLVEPQLTMQVGKVTVTAVIGAMEVTEVTIVAVAMMVMATMEVMTTTMMTMPKMTMVMTTMTTTSEQQRLPHR
jgi:hypothetical protein